MAPFYIQLSIGRPSCTIFELFGAE